MTDLPEITDEMRTRGYAAFLMSACEHASGIAQDLMGAIAVRPPAGDVPEALWDLGHSLEALIESLRLLGHIAISEVTAETIDAEWKALDRGSE